MPVLRFLDVVLVVLTLPVALLLGAPVGGCVIGVGVWVAQRAIAELTVRKAQSVSDVRAAVKLNAAALLGRAWLVTVGVIVAGVGIGDDHGAAAALTVLVAFTAYLALSFVSRAVDAGAPTNPTPPGGSARS